MKINELIRYERKKSDFTLVKLAEKTGISYSKLVRIELGKIIQPDPEELRRLSKALNLEFNQLLSVAGFEFESNNDQENKTMSKISFYNFSDYHKAIIEEKKPKEIHKRAFPFKKEVNLFGLYLDHSFQFFEPFNQLILKRNQDLTENLNFMLYSVNAKSVFFSQLKQFSNTWCYYYMGEEIELTNKEKLLGSVLQVSINE
tara:strand:- start:12595 stop:13197 length:603 start_codon:yes stop_codon:yes gene_type:complete